MQEKYKSNITNTRLQVQRSTNYNYTQISITENSFKPIEVVKLHRIALQKMVLNLRLINDMYVYYA